MLFVLFEIIILSSAGNRNYIGRFTIPPSLATKQKDLCLLLATSEAYIFIPFLKVWFICIYGHHGTDLKIHNKITGESINRREWNIQQSFLNVAYPYHIIVFAVWTGKLGVLLLFSIWLRNNTSSGASFWCCVHK